MVKIGPTVILPTSLPSTTMVAPTSPATVKATWMEDYDEEEDDLTSQTVDKSAVWKSISSNSKSPVSSASTSLSGTGPRLVIGIDYGTTFTGKITRTHLLE
jgi:hypothetical protein